MTPRAPHFCPTSPPRFAPLLARLFARFLARFLAAFLADARHPFQPTPRPKNTPKTPHLALLFALVALTIYPTTAHSYRLDSAGEGKPLRWYKTDTPIYWKLHDQTVDGLSPEAFAPALENRMKTWTSLACAPLDIRFAGIFQRTPNLSYDGDNLIFFDTDGSISGITPQILALTAVNYQPNGQIVEADTVFNALDFTWKIDEPRTDNSVDIATVALHEFGHFLGIAHSEKPCAVMFASYDAAPRALLTDDDRAAYCALYADPTFDVTPPGETTCTRLDENGQPLEIAEESDEDGCTIASREKGQSGAERTVMAIVIACFLLLARRLR